MRIYVENRDIAVGVIDVGAVASASVLLVGDTESIVCGSRFDTPPEGVIVAPLVPLEDV